MSADKDPLYVSPLGRRTKGKGSSWFPWPLVRAEPSVPTIKFQHESGMGQGHTYYTLHSFQGPGSRVFRCVIGTLTVRDYAM